MGAVAGAPVTTARSTSRASAAMEAFSVAAPASTMAPAPALEPAPPAAAAIFFLRWGFARGPRANHRDFLAARSTRDTMRLAVAAALIAAAVAVPAPADFVNTRVVRRIDATKHLVTVTTSFKAMPATGVSGVSTYYVAIPAADAARIAYLTAEAGDDDGAGDKLAITRDDRITRDGFVHYRLKLRKTPTATEPASVSRPHPPMPCPDSHAHTRAPTSSPLRHAAVQGDDGAGRRADAAPRGDQAAG